MKAWRIERLDRTHDRSRFDCGVEALDRWLREVAAQHSGKGLSQTYVAVEADTDPTDILGYYALTLSETDPSGIPEDLRRRYPKSGKLPALRLGRLAVSLSCQGHGLGEFLLMDAMVRAGRVVAEVGGVGLFVDAISSDAATFYRRYGFTPLASDPLKLMLPIAKLKLHR